MTLNIYTADTADTVDTADTNIHIKYIHDLELFINKNKSTNININKKMKYV